MSLLRRISLTDKPFLLFSLLTCLALLVRYLIAAQDLMYLDRLFLPDDTFYTLSISRSIVAGLGPTVDGVHLTNGFQPLISLFQLPIFYLGFNGDSAVRLAIYLSAFWGGLTTLILGYLVLHLSGMRAAVIATLLWIFCPIIIRNDLNGLETSLAGCLSLLAIFSVVLIDKEKTIFRLFCLGIICGLAFLARIDTSFLLGIIGIFALFRWGFPSTAIIVTIALLVVLPWWVYSLINFGTIIPESGAAIKEILVYHNRPEGLPALISLYLLNEWFPLFELTVFTVFLGIVITIFIIVKGVIRSGVFGVILLSALFLQLSFYTFYLPAFWFLSRYFYFIYALIIIFVALALDINNGYRFKRFSSILVVLILITYVAYLIPFFAKPEKAGYRGFDSVDGYRDVALEISAQLSPGDILGAFQSGALSFYAPESVRILNLDGVVSASAAKAFKQKTMKNYVDSHHMTHFADWNYNLQVFKNLNKVPISDTCFQVLYRAKKQGILQFTLYKYNPQCQS